MDEPGASFAAVSFLIPFGVRAISLYEHNHAVEIDWLRNHVDRAKIAGVTLTVVESAEHDDRNACQFSIREPLLLLPEAPAVHHGHREVQENHGGMVFAQRSKPLHPVFRADRWDALKPEILLDHVPSVAMILDDENGSNTHTGVPAPAIPLGWLAFILMQHSHQRTAKACR